MKIVIVGGTHGNEKTGIFLVQKYQKNISLLPNGHEYKLVLGNPRAIQENLRYIDYDLNRSFNSPDIPNSAYERRRSIELKDEVQTWAGGEPFFLIDLHTTTATMGDCLVLSKNDRLSAHVLEAAKKAAPDMRALFNTNPSKGCRFVDSIAPHGLLVEVGPVAQNTYCGQTIQKTEDLLFSVLEKIKKIEKAQLAPITVSGYREGEGVPYPQDASGEIVGAIHPQFKDKNFCEVYAGDSLFMCSDGSERKQLESKGMTPIFIGEAAYMLSKIAFMEAFPVEETFL